MTCIPLATGRKEEPSIFASQIEEIEIEIDSKDQKHDKIMVEALNNSTKLGEKYTYFTILLQDRDYEEIFELFCNLRENRAKLQAFLTADKIYQEDQKKKVEELYKKRFCANCGMSPMNCRCGRWFAVIKVEDLDQIFSDNQKSGSKEACGLHSLPTTIGAICNSGSERVKLTTQENGYDSQSVVKNGLPDCSETKPSESLSYVSDNSGSSPNTNTPPQNQDQKGKKEVVRALRNKQKMINRQTRKKDNSEKENEKI